MLDKKELAELEKVVDDFNREYAQFVRYIREVQTKLSADPDECGHSAYASASEMRLIMSNMHRKVFEITSAKVTCRAMKKVTRHYVKLLVQFSKEWEEVSQTLTFFRLTI